MTFSIQHRASAASIILSCLLLFTLSSCSAKPARLGDKGKGWKVIQVTQPGGKFLACRYDGRFRISAAPSSYNSCDAVMGYNSRTKKCDKDVFLEPSGASVLSPQDAVWRIKPAGKNGYRIIANNAKKCKTGSNLKPLTDVRTAEWDTDVQMGLSKDKKSTYSFQWLSEENTDNSIDCLNNVDIMSSIGTHISLNCSTNQFRYDSDESNWTLTPV